MCLCARACMHDSFKLHRYRAPTLLYHLKVVPQSSRAASSWLRRRFCALDEVIRCLETDEDERDVAKVGDDASRHAAFRPALGVACP